MERKVGIYVNKKLVNSFVNDTEATQWVDKMRAKGISFNYEVNGCKPNEKINRYEFLMSILK